MPHSGVTIRMIQTASALPVALTSDVRVRDGDRSEIGLSIIMQIDVDYALFRRIAGAVLIDNKFQITKKI